MAGSSASRRRGAYGTAAYQRARKAMLAEGAICVHCRRRPATEADHQPPLSLHDHVPGSDCCAIFPSCAPCAREQGARLSAGLGPRSTAVPVVEPPPVELARFDVPWLADLVEVPADATWPRLMTAPHPDAVGSYGLLVEEWSAGRRGRPLRWWQRLFVRRLLEHNAAGGLVWDLAILTLARQLGKTWLLGDVCGWRLHSSGLFGDTQTVLSTGKDVQVSREMQHVHRVVAKRDRVTYHVREVNGQEEIEVIADGSRWMVRAKEAVYGITASMATVDEAWKVLASVVDDGLEPTTVEAGNAQILLVSTAHRRATALMSGRRASALEDLHSAAGSLLVEWSAPADCELDDVEAWRSASPHWTRQRERLIGRRLGRVLAGESQDADEPDPLTSFRTQWLNQWPQKRLAAVKGEPLVDADVWQSCSGEVADAERLVVGVEDHAGFGAAIAAVAVQADGRLGVDGWTVPVWQDALDDLQRLQGGHDLMKLWVGASLLVRLPPGLRAAAGTSTLTRAALPLMRELVTAGQIVHCSDELDDQVDTVRVCEAPGGLVVVPGQRSDLLRAAAWAVAAAHRPRRTPSIH